MNQDNKDIKALIQQGESLTLEFKTDVKSLPDRDLIAAVVSLANTEGGSLILVWKVAVKSLGCIVSTKVCKACPHL